MKRNRKKLIAIGVIVAITALALYLFLPSIIQIPITLFEKTWTSLAGEGDEWIKLTITTSGTTYSAWSASYTVGSASEDYYLINGTYYSEQKLHLSWTLTVEYQNMINIKVVSGYFRLYDSSDGSNYKFCSQINYALSGSSPITYTRSATYSFGDVINYIGGDPTGTTLVVYKFYIKISCQGAHSGNTYTLELPETYIQTDEYEYTTASASASAEPSVSYSSWAEWIASFTISPIGVGVIVGAALLALWLIGKKAKAKSKGGGKRAKKHKHSRKH